MLFLECSLTEVPSRHEGRDAQQSKDRKLNKRVKGQGHVKKGIEKVVTMKQKQAPGTRAKGTCSLDCSSPTQNQG